MTTTRTTITKSKAAAPAPGERSTTFKPAVGQAVRSYDFTHGDDCYVEGIVQKVDAVGVTIKVALVVFSGQRVEGEAGHEVIAPNNGMRGMFSGRETNGVTPAAHI